MAVTREEDLYGPVKTFLEGQGYTVKGEIGGCDLIGVRGDEPPVIVELKLRLSMELILQGIDRLSLSDAVYLAVPSPTRRDRKLGPGDTRVRGLCRQLGLGLMTVDPDRPTAFQVMVILDPLPYAPRRNRARTAKLLGEHATRRGDPNPGGITRRKLVTAYRQDALRCAVLLRAGEAAVADLRKAGAPKNVQSILHGNVYGWFERVARGRYRLTESGLSGLTDFHEVVQLLEA